MQIVVPAVGPRTSDILIVGEAPGRDEGTVDVVAERQGHDVLIGGRQRRRLAAPELGEREGSHCGVDRGREIGPSRS